jgi:CBS domain-containing protein
MSEVVEEVMTPNPVTVQRTETLTTVARRMREEDIGPVVIMDNGAVCGIVTDRDIVVRAIAEGRNPQETKVGEICSKDLTTISKGDSVDDAVRLMREKAIRRLPVVEGGKPVGIVSIGDLAQERDPESALADISTAPPNK